MNELMIVSRIKSPPYKNKREILYQGAVIGINEVPEKLDLKEDSRNYFFSIHTIRKAEGGYRFLLRGFVYDEGNLSLDWHCSSEEVFLPCDSDSKKGLVKFLEES